MFQKIAASLLVGLSGTLLAASCGDDQFCLNGPGDCKGECSELCAELAGDFVVDQHALVYIGKESGAPSCEQYGMSEIYHGWSDLLESPDCPPCGCSDARCFVDVGYRGSQDKECSLLDREISGSFHDEGTDQVWCRDDRRNGTHPPSEAFYLERVFDRNRCSGTRSGTTVNPDATFKTFARVCSKHLLDYTCKEPPLKVCMPKPPTADFHVCVIPDHRNAEPEECPEAYPEKHVFYSEVVHQGCGECQCELKGERTCVYTISLYGDPDCTDALDTFTATEPGCFPMASPRQVQGVVVVTNAATSGECAVVGEGPPSPQKTFTPRRPKVVCCQPSGG
jgi:hypothetical protein